MAEKPMRMTGGVPTWEDWNKLLDYVEARTNIQTDGSIEMSRSYAGVALSVTRRTATASYFWAQITDSELDTDKYAYSWAEVARQADGSYIAVVNGRTGILSAYNKADTGPDSTAIPDGTVVLITVDGGNYTFGASPNGPDVDVPLKVLSGSGDSWSVDTDSQGQALPKGAELCLVAFLMQETTDAVPRYYPCKCRLDQHGQIFLASIEDPVNIGVDIGATVVSNVLFDGEGLKQQKITLHAPGFATSGPTTTIVTAGPC